MYKLMTFLLIVSLLWLSPISIFAASFQGVKYTVIKRSHFRTIKSSIDIRLEKKVSKDFLQKLAMKLRKAEPRRYERIFITYYLPGMAVGSGAWAISHFNPKLKVEILGTTIEEEKIILGGSKKQSGQIIGEWFDDSPYVSAKHTILKRNGKIFLIRKYKDGSTSEEEMIQKKQSKRLRFEKKKGNSFGEYYLIEGNKSLGSYDNEGLIKTMRRLK